MTEKRWEIIDEEFISYTGGTAQLISNRECEIHLWETPKDAQLFCDKLNAINEENEQLKQFQDRVFSWIDMHLQRLPTLIDKEFNSDNEIADPSLYSGALQILETMKKEFKGDVE